MQDPDPFVYIYRTGVFQQQLKRRRPHRCTWIVFCRDPLSLPWSCYFGGYSQKLTIFCQEIESQSRCLHCTNARWCLWNSAKGTLLRSKVFSRFLTVPFSTKKINIWYFNRPFEKLRHRFVVGLVEKRVINFGIVVGLIQLASNRLGTTIVNV